MKKLSTNFLSAIAFAGILAATPLMAQTANGLDNKFAMEAAHGGAAEVMMGKLAQEKAADPDVKAFGELMVHDHTQVNNNLMQVAQAQNMTLPTTPNAKQQAEYQKLSAMSGPAFDKAYVKNQVKDHEEDIKEFTKESQDGKDPQIKQLAAQTLPILQGHLDKAKALEAKMNGKSGGM